MKITVLGCASSLGTPNPGGFWGKCDPANPKNNRTRASILVQSKTTNLYVDATYDVRLHLNRLNLKKVDGVLLSHSHSDHINGIDDFRAIAYHSGKMMDVYGTKETMDEVTRRWPYLFREDPKGVYSLAFKKNIIDDHGSFTVGDIEVKTFVQDHTVMNSTGFRFGDFGYCVDVANLDDKALATLKGVETWMVDGGSYHKETIATHANLKRVMQWAEILKPKMTYLTVLTSHMDYDTLCNELPAHIRPAYDGLEIDMAGNSR